MVCKCNSVNCCLYLYIGDPFARGGSHATKANREISAAMHREALLHLHATSHGQHDLETKVHVCGLIPRILFGTTRGMESIPRQAGSPTRCLAHKTDPAQYACHRELPTTKASCEANDSLVSPSLCVHPPTLRQSSPWSPWATHPQPQKSADPSAAANSLPNPHVKAV